MTTPGDEDAILQEMHSLLEIGMLSFEQGDFSRALALWARLLECLVKTGDTEAAAATLYYMVLAASRLEDVVRARELWELFLGVERRVHESGAQDDMRHRLEEMKVSAGREVAVALSTQGLRSEDVGLMEQAVAILDAIGEVHAKALALAPLAQVLVRQGSGARALQLMQQAAEILNTIGDARGKAMSFSITASIHLQMGEYRSAMEICKMALELQGNIGDKEGRAHSLFLMEKCVALEEEQASRAKAQIERLYELSREDGTIGRLLNAAHAAARWCAQAVAQRERHPAARSAEARPRGKSELSATNEVRLFVSSTFIDFELERRLVHEELVPPLQEVCDHYGLRFSLCDLRYGVTERDATAARTNELCLMEVAHCARISAELYCLCLLGQRYGSRVVPREIEARGLTSLLSSLRSGGKAHARTAELLRAIYDLDCPGARVRKASGSDKVLSHFLEDPETTAVLRSIVIPDQAGEAVRLALALSVTHQEILRANALSGPEGVVTVLRTVVRAPSDNGAALLPDFRWEDRFIDEGPSRAMQERLREAASASPAATVLNLEMPVTSDNQIYKAYVDRFRSTILPPLHEKVLRARARGTRVHRFMGLSRPPPPDAGTSARSLDSGAGLDGLEGDLLQVWLDRQQERPLVIVAERGAFRAELLAGLEAMARERGYARTIRLDLTARPELGDTRNLTLAVLAALGDLLDDEAVRKVEAEYHGDLGAKLVDAVRRAAGSAPLLLIINGIDLVRTAGSFSLHPLWRDVPGLRFACGCEAGYPLLATYAERCCVVVVADRPPRECERILTAAVTRAGLHLPPEDLTAMVGAAVARPTPDYLTALADAYVSSAGDPEAGWNCTSPRQFHETRLRHLIQRAPFSSDVCQAFLGLLAAGPHGVAEEDFLQIAATWPSVHQTIDASFVAPPTGREVPALVWHRLRAHFKDVIEGVGLFDDLTVRPRAADRPAMDELLGREVLRECATRLTEHLWSMRESPPARTVLQLPALLAGEGDRERLGLLFQTKAFTMRAVRLDYGQAMIDAWRSRRELQEGLPVLVDALPPSAGSSTQEESHWLLDLAVLLRSIGHAAEAAKAAHRSLDLRLKALAAGDGRIVDAALQATDSYLEAGDLDKAQRVAEDVLRETEAAGNDSTPVHRLRQNLAAAHAYRGHRDQALPIYLREAAVAEAESRLRDAAGAHAGIANCYADLGDLDKALEHSKRSIDLTILTVGEDSERLAVVLSNQGGIFLARGEPREAAACFERALNIYDRQMDQHHPWRTNTAMGAVKAHVDAGDQKRARDRLLLEISDASFAVFLLWGHVAVPLLLDGMDVDAGAAVDILRRLAGSLRSELRAVAGTPSRAFDKFAALALAGAQGLQMSRSEGYMAQVLIAICRWLLMFVEAMARGLLSHEEIIELLRDLETFLSRKVAPPCSLLDLERHVGMVWSNIEVRAAEVERRGLLRSLVAEATGSAARMMGRVEESDAALGRSIEDIEMHLAVLRSRRPVDENETGQLCILLASKYAAAGRREEAISCQREVVLIAEKLFGKQSKYYWTAVINLGSVLRQAGRHTEAFTSYQVGLREIAVLDAASADEMSGSLEKVMALGFEMNELVAVGELLDLFGTRFSDPRVGVNVSLMAIIPWVNAGRIDRALHSFQRSITILADVKWDVGRWLGAAMAPVAVRLMSLRLTEQEQSQLLECFLALRQMAKERHLIDELDGSEEWRDMLVWMLQMQGGCPND